MLWVGVHLPALSLEAFRLTLGALEDDDATRGPGVALIERHRIVAVDAAGREHGVEPGLKRATALGLAPRLRVGEADPARDEAELLAVCHVLLAFTPIVTLAPGHVVLADVQGSLRYFGGLAGLLARLRGALSPLGHALRIACAPTAQAAQWFAALRDDGEAGIEPPRAKPALRERVGRLPLALMAAAQPHLVTLGTLGLQTAAELWKQPRAGVNRRFGSTLLADIDRACGDLGDPRTSVVPPPEFHSRVELFTRAEDSAALLVGATVLLHRLTAWAAACHGRIGAFELRLHHESRLRARVEAGNAGTSAITPLALNLGEPVSDAAHLQTLLRERLQRVPLASPVLELSLHCSALVAGAPPNGELFPCAAGAAEGWQRLLERFEARLGAHQLRRLEIVADHRPERATRERPASARGVSASAPLALPTPSDDDAMREGDPATWPRQRRPAWLLPEPRPLREADGTPLLAGRPLWLVAGPERIEAGWWDEHFAARDYFIAQAENGALLWVYRFRLPPSANESGWYLQGWFG